MVKKGLVKKKKRGDTMIKFWYTLKNLHLQNIQQCIRKGGQKIILAKE
jgi:hypothetical protein